jgi:DNA mismatch endonuclease, patch repair protein
MKKTRGQDNPRELAIRSALHRAGVRFRVAFPIPGLRRRTMDIAFTRQRLAVFLDGCFWHACPVHGTLPKTSTDWWLQKLRANVTRDQHTTEHLISEGWHVIRIWEHVPLEEAVRAILESLGTPPSSG